ncbi:MAG: 50S ribosomal protein L19 [Planctomycetes bacterium]|nr:50S ribosomal protein L19 [Planctomycetota bacterium]
MKLVRELESKYTKQNLPTFNVGDNVDVEVRIKEGDKERIQLFSGVVIQVRGSGIRTMFTVRRIVQGEGVERVFPLHSPKIANVVVRREGRVRRSKLYYLRGRTGRAARIDEKARATKGE